MIRRLALGLFVVVVSQFSVSCSAKKQDAPPPYTPNCDDLPGATPEDLRCTGLYSDFASKALSPDAKPYTPGFALWSDAAEKSRFLYLPPQTQIDTTDMDEWKFPIGTKVWKEFRLNGKRIETRLFYKQTAAKWVWTTYRWTDDESRAPRLTTGEENVMGAYDIPDQIACDKCHRGRRDKLLGLEAIALGSPSAQGITLASLVAENKLSKPPAQTQIAVPEDATGKAAAAIGYLHMNCGVSCHINASYVEGSESGLFMRLSATQLLAGGVQVKDLDVYKTAVDVAVTHQRHFTYAQKGYFLIKPGDSSKSLVVALSALRDGKEQMPPIGSRLADDQGVAAMKAWIDALR